MDGVFREGKRRVPRCVCVFSYLKWLIGVQYHEGYTSCSLCCHDNAGVMLKGVLVPLDKDYIEGEEESEVEDRRKRKRTHSAEANRKRFGTQEDREFSPLRFSDPMGDTKERSKILS